MSETTRGPGLVERLREPIGETYGSWTPDEIRTLLSEAADEITRLTAALATERANLHEAMMALRFGGHLRPDGSVCGYIESDAGICNKCGFARRALTDTRRDDG
jgi:hypothetical protein